MAKLFRKQRRDGTSYAHWYARVWNAGTREWDKISTRCTSKAAAQAVADDRESDLAGVGGRSARRASGATFGHAVEAKLSEDLARVETGDLAKDTWAFYRSKGAQLVARIGSDVHLAEFTPATVERYIHGRLVDDGAARHTVTKELVTIRQVLRQAKRRGEWTGDLEAVMPDRWKVGYKPRRRWLPPDEVPRLLEKLSTSARAWVCLAIVIAGSAKEVRGVRLADVGAWTIHVRGTKRATRDRIVPILPHVWDLWSEAWRWLELHGSVKRWPDSNRTRDLRKACDLAKIEHVTANDLRRTAAMWIRQRSTGELAGLFLGHSDSRMVDQVYARLSGAELGGAIGAKKGERG